MRRIRQAAQIALLFALYFFLGRLGLRLQSVGGFSTLLWAPTGLALAAMLLFGSYLWPGVWLGAFAVNLVTGAPLPAALGMATGNTLETVIAVQLLTRVAKFDPALPSVRDVLALIFFGGLLSTAVSASVGVLSLRLAGGLSAAETGSAWTTWWLGDMLSDLVVAPFLLVWGSRPGFARVTRLQRIEALSMTVLFIAGSVAVYFLQLPPVFKLFPLPMATFPFIIWAVLRFGQAGAVTGSFLVSLLAFLATLRGVGPFVNERSTYALWYLETYRIVAAASVLIFAAVVSERERQRLRAQATEAESVRLLARLEEAVRVRDDFIAIASHELKTPVTSLKLQSEMLARAIEKGITEQAQLQRHVAKSLRQIDGLTALIENILDISKLRSGGAPELHLEPLDLAALIDGVVERQSEDVKNSGSQVAFEAERPLPGCWDRVRLEKVVANLLNNALKYGGGKPILIQARRAGAGAVEFSFRDQGIGIAEADQARIFERFERSAQVSRYGGFGLGLYIVRQDLEAHGGAIRVESEPGAGSRFVVTLPVMPPVSQAARAA
jgi:signal transduction histidine kinase